VNDSWLERHRRSVLLLVLILALGGFFSAWRLPVGLFPLIDFPRIVVSVDAGDRPADRMVAEVTRPLELALRGVPNVEKIRSTSSRGSAEVSLTLAWGSDMVAAQLQMEAAVNRLLPKLPLGTTFTTRRMDPTVFPSLGLTLISKTDDLVALRDFATYQLKPAILAIGGVIDAEVLGGRQAEYQVLLDPLRLQAVGLTSAEVIRMLAANNGVVAIGRIEDNYRLYLTVVDNRLRNLDDIRRSIVKTEKSAIVTLADVADVRLGEQPEWTRVNADGHDAVLINIRQQRGANTVALVSDVRDLLAKMQTQIPADIQVGTFYDQSELIVSSASGVRDAILIGAILAALILFVFFRSLRLTLVIALVLPVVICISVLLLGLLHMSRADRRRCGGAARTHRAAHRRGALERDGNHLAGGARNVPATHRFIARDNRRIRAVEFSQRHHRRIFQGARADDGGEFDRLVPGGAACGAVAHASAGDAERCAASGKNRAAAATCAAPLRTSHAGLAAATVVGGAGRCRLRGRGRARVFAARFGVHAEDGRRWFYSRLRGRARHLAERNRSVVAQGRNADHGVA